MKRLMKLREDKKALVGTMRGMVEAGDFSPEQDTEYKGHEAKLAKINADIEREEALAAQEDQVKVAMGTASDADYNRLHGAATGGSATSGPDGGFLIQKDFTVDLMNSGFETGVLSSRCSDTTVGAGADGLEVVITDHTDRTTGNRWGGVQVYRLAEAETVTAKKPQLDRWECRLEDMMGLAYMTERLLQDAPAMQSVYSESFTEEFGWKLDNEIYAGTGAGQCLGVLTALDSAGKGPTISQAKETGQAAGTVVAENIIKMWSHVSPRSRLNGIWVYNPELDPQLLTMMIGTGTSGQLVYMAPGGLSGSQYGTIYGRPVVPLEQALAPGTVGDIAFLDLSQYKLIRKDGITAADSIHVRFLNNERAFRWVARVNGKPKAKAAQKPANGSSGFKLSPFVTLATR
jgi:HK97 family phage major capsid protein